MESASPRPARWILLATLSLAAVLMVGLAGFFIARKPPLASSPTQPRPWAEAIFRDLTNPLPSPGLPTAPQYTARHGGSSPATDRNCKVKVVIEPAPAEFVPNYEVLEFDAADGFTCKSGSGKIRWLAAKAYDLQLDRDPDPAISILAPFHPDGKPMGEDEANVMGISKRDREAWGLELDGEGGTAMKLFLELKGFPNLQWKFQTVFDAATHVSVLRLSSVSPVESGLRFDAALAVLHDTPLLAVIDLAHGETQDFQIPVAKGASVSYADFRIEVIDVFAGSVGHGSIERINSGSAIEQQYGVNTAPGEPDSFSVIYQINPPVMATAVSVDALDAAGKQIENHGRFMDDAPVSKFGAPLASAVSLRVRYRPHLTRLLMKMKSPPGVTAPNVKPVDLFDVSAPTILFGNSSQMRHFITSGTQLKDVTGSFSYETPAAFPMTLTNVSPRQVVDRYLALDSGRQVKVDPVALTAEFEPPKKPSWLEKTMDWFNHLWRP